MPATDLRSLDIEIIISTMPYSKEHSRRHAIWLKKANDLWGKASNWQCVLCFSPAQSWAHLWRTHAPEDPEGFVPMCWKDHSSYDLDHHLDHYAKHSEFMKGNQNLMGHQFTDESRAKMSASRKAYLENNPGPNKGRKFSAETKAKMSAARKAFLRNHGSPNLGRKASEETKAKMSNSQKARWNRKRGGEKS